MFDPLHKWLDIPPAEQPGNHYRLLGITIFESDQDVIDAAADKQLAFLHDLANGEHGQAASEISNRITRARVELLNPKRKAAYDQSLRESLIAKSSVAKTQPTLPEGWGLRHGDGVEHGPFQIDQLIEAARAGNIAPDTQIRHAALTDGQWVVAATRPEIQKHVASLHGATSDDFRSPVETPSQHLPSLGSRRTKVTPNRKNKYFAIASRIIFSLMWISIPVAMVYFNPRLRQLILGEQIPDPIVVDSPPTVHRKRSPTPPPKQSVENTPIVVTKSEPLPQRIEPAESAREMEAEAPNQNLPKETLVHLKLQLDSRVWIAPIPNGSESDDYFVQSVSGGGASIQVFPTSGKVTFNQPLTISFNGAQGLTMKLRLAKTGREKALSLSGSWVMKSSESTEIPFSKDRMQTRLRFLQKQSFRSNQFLAQLKSDRNQKQLFIDSKGIKTLASVNAFINVDLPALV